MRIDRIETASKQYVFYHTYLMNSTVFSKSK